VRGAARSASSPRGVALVALAAGGWLALPDRPPGGGQRLAGATRGRLARVDRTSATAGSPAQLRVLDGTGAPGVARLTLGSLRDLLRGHLHIASGTLDTPTLRIVTTGPGEFNVSDLLARQGGAGTGPALTLERFALTGGAVEIEDRTLAPPRVWRVEAVALEARGVSTLAAAPPGIVTVSAVVAGAPVSLWVTESGSPASLPATASARRSTPRCWPLPAPPAAH
jgi:hypothetical protein